MVLKAGSVATGEIEDTKAAPQAKSGKTRAKALTPKQRSDAASLAASATGEQLRNVHRA